MAIIFIPGIKGTELVDTWPLDHPRRWPRTEAMPGDMIDDPWALALVDGRYDMDGHWMQPSRLVHQAYGPMIHRLRWALTPEPVYAFGYDWRKRLEDSALLLVRMLEEVTAREKASGRDGELSLVSFSMGGLLLRSALALRSKRDPFAGIHRVVFIAPPFRGALGSAHALVAGDNDDRLGTDPAYRKIARGFPSIYQMTPSWPTAAVDEDGRNVDLFDPSNWQDNVAQGRTFRSDFLRDAEAFVRGRKARHGGDSQAPMLADTILAAHPDKVLIACGSGQPTPCSLPVRTHNRSNPHWFDFAQMQLDTHGDGRVWMRSAAIKGVTLAAFADSDVHGLLCRDTRIASLVCAWLQTGKAPMLTPRTPTDSIKRRRRHFNQWDGNPNSFDKHVI